MCVRNSKYDPKIDWLKVKILNMKVEKKKGDLKTLEMLNLKDEGMRDVLFFFSSFLIVWLFIHY